jgi:hypothetical protein
MDAELRARKREGDQAGTHLRQRMRTGELSEHRVRIAAHLGHSEARDTLGLGPQSSDSLEAWAHELASLGLEALVRSAIAVAHSVLGESCSPGLSRRNLEAAEAWASCPCDAHAAAAHATAREGNLGLPTGEGVYVPGRGSHDACRIAAELAGSSQDGLVLFDLAPRLSLAIAQARVDSSAGDQVLSALYTELVPWALGAGDAVEDRVAPRERLAALPPRERMLAQIEAGGIPLGCIVTLDHTRLPQGYVLGATGAGLRHGPAPKKLSGVWLVRGPEPRTGYVSLHRVSKKTHETLRMSTANTEYGLERQHLKAMLVAAELPPT